MAQFDPDAYLAAKRAAPPHTFDPDAYLASKRAAPPPGMRPVQPGEIPTESGFYAEPTPEVPRTFMQRAMGTAAAPLDIALTMGSAAARGLAAPIYGLVTGSGEEGAKEVLSGIRQPQTPEAQAALEAAAPVLQALPPVIGTGQPALGTAGAASRQAGRAVGQEAQMVRGAIEAPLAARREAQALKASAADYQRAPQIDAAQKAVEYGIALNPAESNPNMPNRVRSMLVGNRDVNAQLAAQNAPKWTELAKRDMNIPQQTQLNAEGYALAQRQYDPPYEQIRRMGTMTASDEVRSALENLYILEPTVGGEASAKRVNKQVAGALKKVSSGMNGPLTLESIKQLRSDAQTIRNAQKVGQALSPARIAEAEVKLKIANTLEAMVEENIFDPRFLGKFRDARRGKAKVFAYEEATDFNTGRVDPMAIARITQQDNALTGIIADIGAIAGNYPQIAAPSVPATAVQRRLTRSGIAGTLGAGLGSLTATPAGVITGGMLGAGIGEIYTGLRARKIGTPEYQQRFATPVDRRIRPPQVNELAPPTPGTPALYNWENALAGTYQPNFIVPGAPQTVPLRPRSVETLLREAETSYGPSAAVSIEQPPDVRFVGPRPGPAQLPAPSAESTMASLRAEDVRRAGVSRAIGQEAEAAQAAAESAARRPATREVILDFDPITGRYREASQGLRGATPETFQNFGANLELAAEKVTQGRRFDLTAAEKVAWERTKVDLAEVAPGMKSLSDKAIAEKMMDRQWVADAVRTAREKAAAFEQIAARAKDAQARQKALADRERMMDLLETLEAKFSAGRPQPSGGQGPKTREFQRNQLLQSQEQNRNKLIEP
ncbi:MAG: hypothetical protein ACO3RW_00355 [Burkholderiaceae bacterium]